MKVLLSFLAFTALVFGLAAPASASGSRLRTADRKAINHTIDILVNSAVKRHDVLASYGIVTPTLRAGMTRKEWATGSIPVYPYPARGTTFHQWTIKYVTPEEVAVELMLQPTRGSKTGPILFDVYLDPIHGKWLVDSFMPVALFAPLTSAHTKVTALNDFMPVAGSKRDSGGEGTPRVNSNYAFVPFAVIGAVVLAFGAAVVIGGFRYRPKAASLPPFPGSRRAR